MTTTVLPSPLTTTNGMHIQSFSSPSSSALPTSSRPNGKRTSSSSSSSSTNPLSSLRTMYPRATHAFLQRDLKTTKTLVEAAFGILGSPPNANVSDNFSSQRRKWDILRITLDTTLYGSPTPPSSPDGGSKQLNGNGNGIGKEAVGVGKKQDWRTPSEFVEFLRTRSFGLFTPANLNPSISYVPPQIVLLLAVSAVKFDALPLAREIVEDWLTKRSTELAQGESEAYEKIIEVYCVHVLARLGLWDDAREFLKYESELPHLVRERLISTLEAEHARAITPRSSRRSSKRPSPSTTPPLPIRSSSPSGSISSASSASTQTAVPATPRGNGIVNGNRASTDSSSTVSSSASAATIKASQQPYHHHPANGLRPLTTTPKPNGSANGHVSSSSSSSSPLPPRLRSSSSSSHLQPTHSNPPSVYALVKQSIRPYLKNFTGSAIVWVLIPLVFILIRYLRRIKPGVGSSTGGSRLGAAQAARNRLYARQVGIGWVWDEAVRVIWDTIGMAGKGLV